MTITQPYFRICRPFADGNYINNIDHNYLLDQKYAKDRVDFIRAYHLLEKELLNIFDFVEPHYRNRRCFSHKIYSLLVRASTEFESNAKAILRANGYIKYDGNGKKIAEDRWNINDYFKLKNITRLDEYQVTIPIWNGALKTFSPFKGWGTSHSLPWYKSYNDVKHNRFDNFSSASLENAINAVGAVLAILFAQFNAYAFHYNLSSTLITDGFEFHESYLLGVKLPVWLPSERYDFKWDNSISECQSYPF